MEPTALAAGRCSVAPASDVGVSVRGLLLPACARLHARWRGGWVGSSEEGDRVQSGQGRYPVVSLKTEQAHREGVRAMMEAGEGSREDMIFEWVLRDKRASRHSKNSPGGPCRQGRDDSTGRSTVS